MTRQVQPSLEMLSHKKLESRLLLNSFKMILNFYADFLASVNNAGRAIIHHALCTYQRFWLRHDPAENSKTDAKLLQGNRSCFYITSTHLSATNIQSPSKYVSVGEVRHRGASGPQKTWNFCSLQARKRILNIAHLKQWKRKLNCLYL